MLLIDDNLIIFGLWVFIFVYCIFLVFVVRILFFIEIVIFIILYNFWDWFVIYNFCFLLDLNINYNINCKIDKIFISWFLSKKRIRIYCYIIVM